MFYSDNDMHIIRKSIEGQSNLDPELIERCSPLFHINAVDNAVRTAFIILEERLRKIIGKEGLTGVQMVDFAFKPNDGVLTKLLSHNTSERDGIKNLLTGAFQLYRNPAMHTDVGFSQTEGKSIIALIDLLLKRLNKIAELVVLTPLPNNVEAFIGHLENCTDNKVASRMRIFLNKCVRLGYDPRSSAKTWISFRKRALMKYEQWSEPKPHPLTAFYLYDSEKTQSMWFPISEFYVYLVGHNKESTEKSLSDIGFKPTGKYQSYVVDLQVQNGQQFFDKLATFIYNLGLDLEQSLK